MQCANDYTTQNLIRTTHKSLKIEKKKKEKKNTAYTKDYYISHYTYKGREKDDPKQTCIINEGDVKRHWCCKHSFSPSFSLSLTLFWFCFLFLFFFFLFSSFFSSSQVAVLSLMLVNLDWSMFKRTKWYETITQKIIFHDIQT